MQQAEKRFNVVLDLCACNRDDMAAVTMSRYKTSSLTLLAAMTPEAPLSSCLPRHTDVSMLQAEKRFNVVLDLCARNRDEIAAITTNRQ